MAVLLVAAATAVGFGQSTLSSSQVQQVLLDHGYDLGTVDGKWGPLSRTALATFQADNGLPATGELDDKTLALLIAADTGPALSARPSQPSEPTLQSIPTKPATPTTSSNLRSARSATTTDLATAWPEDPSASEPARPAVTAERSETDTGQFFLVIAAVVSLLAIVVYGFSAVQARRHAPRPRKARDPQVARQPADPSTPAAFSKPAIIAVSETIRPAHPASQPPDRTTDAKHIASWVPKGHVASVGKHTIAGGITLRST